MIDDHNFWEAFFKGALLGGGISIAALVVFSIIAVVVGEMSRWFRRIDKEKEGKDE